MTGHDLAGRLRRGDGAVVLGSVVTLAAAPTLVLGGTRAGLVVLVAGLAVSLLGLARVSQVVLQRLGGIAQAQERQTRRADRQARLLRRLRVAVRRTREEGRDAARVSESAFESTADRQRQHAGAVDVLGRGLVDVSTALGEAEERRRADSLRFRTSLDTLPSDLVRWERHLARLSPATAALPGLGDWALTPGTLVVLLDEVERRPDARTVLECGSGSSTLYLALALAARGGPARIVALDSDPAFAEETRVLLRRHGVDHLAEVVDAPLVDVTLPSGDVHRWFDVAGLPDLPPVDLLFVDGPVGGSAHLARYPALPVLAPMLAPGALVVLDDTDRPHEQEILRRWLEEGDAQLVVERRNVRSTFLRLAAPTPRG